ncbi:MAG: tRNA pseudouridine(38-40) synthase TruA [Bacteroidetes bacterium]|nr:tRNA pseudouridine(38-40) synthase TruA [Bacteroidota bacterium]
MSEKQRYFIQLAYDGTDFHGWQIQPNATTVQELLNDALTIVLREPIETTGCGRTDTGVHARDFFAHFDSQSLVNGHQSLVKVVESVNAILPSTIAVKRIIQVAAEAHARFDATSRSYEYHVHFNKDPFKIKHSWQLRDKPDIALMNAAARIIIEYTDFSCFSKSNTQTYTNNCKITRAEWVYGGHCLVFHITADRFLRNMVRAIVGTLMQVGRKEIQPEDVRAIIESKNRSNAGTSVPACGLYLTEIKYPYL